MTQLNNETAPVKVLFVCSRNEIRSLTAEHLLEGVPGYHARSAGTEAGARVRVTEGHIGWADLVFVMEKRHKDRLAQKFGDALHGKVIVCLHIPDDYEFMDETLLDVLRSRLEGHLTFPSESE